MIKKIAKKMLSEVRNLINREIYKYPSFLNDGQLHINRAVDLAKALDINERSGIILDIGAANGTIALKLKNDFSESTIYCFEPIKSTFEKLKANVQNVDKIEIFNLGCGSTNEDLIINKTSRITSSSIFEIESDIKDDFLGSNISKTDIEKIKVMKVDDIIPKNIDINLIKLDVQGYELEALKGCDNSLKRTAIIVIEMQNHDIYKGAPKYFDLDAFLRQHNFILYDIIPSIRRRMKLYEWDSIYINSFFDEKLNN